MGYRHVSPMSGFDELEGPVSGPDREKAGIVSLQVSICISCNRTIFAGIKRPLCACRRAAFKPSVIKGAIEVAKI